MAWKYSIHDGHTGDLLQGNLHPTSSSGDRILNGVGAATHSFLVEDGTPFVWRNLIFPLWDRIIVAAWDGVAKYAGYIHTMDPWKRASRTITLRSICVRDFLSNRFLYPVDEGSYRGGTRSVVARSHAATLRAILAAAATGRGGNWDLPIVLPEDAAGVISRTWWFYEMWTAEKAFTEIQNLEEGPDVDFEPRYRPDGGIEWVVRAGSPRLDEGDFEFDIDAPESGITDVDYRLNGQDLRTGSMAIGKGSEASMRVGFAYSRPGSSALIRDRADQYKDIDDQGVLDNHALSDLVVMREPTEQWAYTMRANAPVNGRPGLAELRLGSVISLHVKRDPIIPDSPAGGHQQMVIGYRFDLTDAVPLIVQRR